MESFCYFWYLKFKENKEKKFNFSFFLSSLLLIIVRMFSIVRLFEIVFSVSSISLSLEEIFREGIFLENSVNEVLRSALDPEFRYGWVLVGFTRVNFVFKEVWFWPCPNCIFEDLERIFSLWLVDFCFLCCN